MHYGETGGKHFAVRPSLVFMMEKCSSLLSLGWCVSFMFGWSFLTSVTYPYPTLLVCVVVVIVVVMLGS